MPDSSRPEPQHTPAVQATFRGPDRSAHGPRNAVHAPRDSAHMENIGTTDPCTHSNKRAQGTRCTRRETVRIWRTKEPQTPVHTTPNDGACDQPPPTLTERTQVRQTVMMSRSELGRIRNTTHAWLQRVRIKWARMAATGVHRTAQRRRSLQAPSPLLRAPAHPAAASEAS